MSRATLTGLCNACAVVQCYGMVWYGMVLVWHARAARCNEQTESVLDFSTNYCNLHNL